MLHGVRLQRFLITLIGFASLLIAHSPVQAANFSPGCTAGVGDAVALQTAVTTANGNAQPDTITLAAGCTYTPTATLSIASDGSNMVTINGNGATISGGNTRRVLYISPSAFLTLNNVTVANGSVAVNGAGIFNEGSVTLYNSMVTGNTATGTGLGGGIYNADNRALNIFSTTFSGNAAVQGGAIYNAGGTITIENAIFTTNSATSGGAVRGANGPSVAGGISIKRSLFSGNTATSTAGGLYNESASLYIDSSTFTGNQAAFGAGLYLFSGSILLLNNTISGNTASNNGGGITTNFAPGLLSNIVAANSAPTSPDIKGNINSSGYNLIGNSSGTTGTNANDLLDAAATPLNLGPLADNGGPTQTMALLAGSVAIDRGDPTQTSSNTYFDQRDLGYPRVVNGRIDIGAFELQPPCPSFPASIPNGNSSALINAIHCANRTPGSETISLATVGAYQLTSPIIGANIIYNNGLPYIASVDTSGALTINGNGATIGRGAGAPQFRILEVASGGNLTINNVTISNGLLTSGALSPGGGVFNAGTLTVNSSTISGNQARYGGGIYNAGMLSVTSSSIANNTAMTRAGGIFNYAGSTAAINTTTINGNSGGILGGGIYSEATMTINNSTVSNNVVLDGASDGGGIASLASTLTISGSTINGNQALDRGGGIITSGTLTMTNSTVYDNLAGPVITGDGGGIYVIGTATITHSTISGNGATDNGGGIFISGSVNVTLGNTIVAANDATAGDDVFGTVTSQGYNLIGSSSGVSGLVATDLRDASGTPLNLGLLASNGGPTQTMALLAGSVAISRGNPSFVPPPDTDQRGTGFPRVRTGRVDIGAYEAPGPSTLTLQLTLQGRPAAPNPAYVTTVHVQLRPTGGGAALMGGDYVSDTSGQVTIPDLPTGSYNLWIKGTHTLARLHAITLAAGSNNLTTSLLLEGDADDSNSVILTDFSLLAASFGKSSAQVGYDARADFNQDNAVNLTDFSLLASNFNQAGVP